MGKSTSNDSPWKGILAKDIDEYIASVPEEARDSLRQLREIIKQTAPEATEAIYYRIPTFLYDGPLVGFSVSKNHCSLHLMSPPVMAAHQEELKSYDTTTATIRFSFDRPPPASLVAGLVKERMAENEKRKKK